MLETNEYFALLDRVSRTTDKLSQLAATEAVNFSKERFRSQNWVDGNTEPWKKRKQIRGESNRRSGRAILVDTGRLRRSIRKVRVTKDSALIGTDVPYAQAHNDGYRGTVNQNVRSHVRKTRSRTVQVTAHSRKVNMNLPRRRFIGTSTDLDNKLTRTMTLALIRAIKNT